MNQSNPRCVSLTLFILILTVVFGCSQGKVLKPGVTYKCDGGKIFIVDLYDKVDIAFVKIDRKRFYLPRVPSASGAEYREGNVTLRIEGDRASIEIDGQTEFKNCSVKPQ